MTDYRSNEPQLIQFVREKGKRVPKILADGKVVMVREKGLPRGILVAGMVNGIVRIGWSYTNKRMDNFDKVRGMNIAVGRMQTPSSVNNVPHKVVRETENTFLPRVEKHFNVSVG